MAQFPTNEGLFDRGFRIWLGLGLVATMFVGPATWLGAVGLLPLFTGIAGCCPFYAALGLRTADSHFI